MDRLFFLAKMLHRPIVVNILFTPCGPPSRLPAHTSIRTFAYLKSIFGLFSLRYEQAGHPCAGPRLKLGCESQTCTAIDA